MRVAVGSTNPAKLDAVRAAIVRVWPQAQVEGVAVASGVAEMPMSDAECLMGARNRAHAAREALGANLGVGLEGGAQRQGEMLLLVGWVVACAADGREGVAGTARLPLPALIADRVLAGEELGPVMDDLLDEHKSNHRGGAVGALTAGLVLRGDAFAMAVSYALSPFVAAEFYSR
ncbi:MAG TPA: inosine/xanthosine triphosphatase [Candidatus Binatia bacterium]|jgi:inosine/xanthosine triphosphatase|nr:inosine/xanthosine triphosphatase [Candidatus Binatia bacterium]